MEESYDEKYGRMWTGMKKVTPELHEELVQKCQGNDCIKHRGWAFADDPLMEWDSPYSFVQIDDIEALELYFEHGNWSVRSGVIYRDLAFIQQANGGDEWWTLKKGPEGYEAFESVTFGPMIRQGEFQGFIESLTNASLEQCLNLEYRTASALDADSHGMKTTFG